MVAFSGGRDSVALLHVLQLLRQEFSYELGALHVNHGISPQAPVWQAFCQDFCADRDLPLTVETVDVERKSPQGLEASARDRRYEALQTAGADWVAFAHHRGDQAETLLFKLLRGPGLAGAAGMPEQRSLGGDSRLIRPLLACSRAEIEQYVLRQGLSWIDDESNSDTGYARNFLRHSILPLLQARFPAAEAKLASASGHFAEARELLDELARLDLAGTPPTFPLPMSCLHRLSELRARNLLRFLLTQHGVQIPSELRFKEFVRQLREADQDRRPSASFGAYRITRQRGLINLG